MTPAAQPAERRPSFGASLAPARAAEPAPAPIKAITPAPSRGRIPLSEFFGQQPSGSAALPDPAPLVDNLTRCVIEILAGARDLEQVARWVTDDVYRHLLKRVVISSRARSARGQKTVRPWFGLGSTTITEPRDGVVEAVVIVRGRARTRAVAIRLEGFDSRWRATAINVL
ncbi:MAG TPA: Rv3235 family protein [Galbitalea sp.]